MIRYSICHDLHGSHVMNSCPWHFSTLIDTLPFAVSRPRRRSDLHRINSWFACHVDLNHEVPAEGRQNLLHVQPPTKSSLPLAPNPSCSMKSSKINNSTLTHPLLGHFDRSSSAVSAAPHLSSESPSSQSAWPWHANTQTQLSTTTFFKTCDAPHLNRNWSFCQRNNWAINWTPSSSPSTAWSHHV